MSGSRKYPTKFEIRIFVFKRLRNNFMYIVKTDSSLMPEYEIYLPHVPCKRLRGISSRLIKHDISRHYDLVKVSVPQLVCIAVVCTAQKHHLACADIKFLRLTLVQRTLASRIEHSQVRDVLFVPHSHVKRCRFLRQNG